MTSEAETADKSVDISHLVDGLTNDPKSWHKSSLISVTQLTPGGLTLLFSTAAEMRSMVRSRGGSERLKHNILSSVFYEASTRTNCSFQTAMMRLGGKVIHVDAGGGGNSAASKKGESLSDTIRCLQCYTDVTVLRHGQEGTVADVLVNGRLGKPVLNAGDGVGEHPTQALLDLFTIVDELDLFGGFGPLGLTSAGTGRGLKHRSRTAPPKSDYTALKASSKAKKEKDELKQIVVVLVGDLKHGRTVHSLAKLLARIQAGFLKRRLVLKYCSPSNLAMPKDVKDYVADYAGRPGYDIVQEEMLSGVDADSEILGMPQDMRDYVSDYVGSTGKDITTNSEIDISDASSVIEEALKDANVLYVTRVQKERFANLQDYEAVKGLYVIDKAMMANAPKKMIVMHPLPRVDEISTEVDADPRAAYFRQMENGMFVRMAILDLILREKNTTTNPFDDVN